MILLKFIFFFASHIFFGIHSSCSCTHSSSQLDTTFEKLHNVVILCRLDNVSATGRRSTKHLCYQTCTKATYFYSYVLFNCDCSVLFGVVLWTATPCMSTKNWAVSTRDILVRCCNVRGLRVSYLEVFADFVWMFFSHLCNRGSFPCATCYIELANFMFKNSQPNFLFLMEFFVFGWQFFCTTRQQIMCNFSFNSTRVVFLRLLFF